MFNQPKPCLPCPNLSVTVDNFTYDVIAEETGPVDSQHEGHDINWMAWSTASSGKLSISFDHYHWAGHLGG